MFNFKTMENERLIGGIDAVRLSLQTTETNARVANARKRGIEQLSNSKTKGGCAYIPTDGSVPRGFISGHSINNYFWIFKLTNAQDGYVIPHK
jgi:hypothetical protein